MSAISPANGGSGSNGSVSVSSPRRQQQPARSSVRNGRWMRSDAVTPDDFHLGAERTDEAASRTARRCRRRSASCRRTRGRRRRPTAAASRTTSTGARAGEEARVADGIAPDVPQRSAAERRIEPHVVLARQRKGERSLEAADRRRAARSARSRSTACVSGWCRYMNASAATRDARVAAASIRSTSSTVSASGFSHSTCLPASSARTVHSTCRLLGRPM